MRRHSTTRFAALSLAALLPPAAFGATETFNTEPADWVGSGNTADGNNFGFSDSDNTGGLSGPGEAGGLFVRSIGLHYYADTNIGGTLSLNDPLTVSGEFDITGFSSPDHGFGVGFINTTTPTPAGNGEVANFLGVLFNEPQDGANFRGSAAIRLGNGNVRLSNVVPSPTQLDRTFSVTWDPASRTLSGDLGGTPVSVTIDEGDFGTGATFDAFGLYTSVGSGDNPNLQANAFFDNLTYTEVPEPAAAALVALACFTFASPGGRYRRHQPRTGPSDDARATHHERIAGT